MTMATTGAGPEAGPGPKGTGVQFAGSKKFHLGDAAFKGVLWLAAGIVLVTLGAILVILLSFQVPRRSSAFGPAFMWTDQWDPVRDLYGARSACCRHVGFRSDCARHRLAARASASPTS